MKIFKFMLLLIVVSLVGCATSRDLSQVSTPSPTVIKKDISTRVYQRSLENISEEVRSSDISNTQPIGVISSGNKINITQAELAGVIGVNAAPTGIQQPNEVVIIDRIWRIKSGESVRNVIDDWCRQAGWDLVWRYEGDLTAQGSAEFSGNFSKVIRELLDALPSSTKIQAELGSNKLILVTKREN